MKTILNKFWNDPDDYETGYSCFLHLQALKGQERFNTDNLTFKLFMKYCLKRDSNFNCIRYLTDGFIELVL